MDNQLETNLGIMFAPLPNRRGIEIVAEHRWSYTEVLMFVAVVVGVAVVRSGGIVVPDTD